MLESYLVQTCEKVIPTRSRYGDYILNTVATLSCRFRFIVTERRASHQEVQNADAMVWFAPDTSIAIGDLLRFDGQYYQVERLNKARKLGSTQVEFLKCDVKITDIAIS